MRLPLLLALCIAAAACTGEPIRKVPSGNKDASVTVEVVAMFGEITLYRVMDGSHPVYVASSGTTSCREDDGKTSVNREVQTLRR